MHYFPVNLDISNRLCIVIGGGPVAERKSISLLECGARLRIISPDLTAELAVLREAGKFQWQNRVYKHGDLEGAFLVIAATDDQEVQKAVFAEAEAKNILLNVADAPQWCNFILPASLRRGDLAISISTGGKSPALARRLRQELEEQFGDEYGLLLDIMGNVRQTILEQGNSHEDNKKIFNAVLSSDMLTWASNKEWGKIAKHIQAVTGMDVELSVK